MKSIKEAGQLRTAIERYETLYLTAGSHDLKRQIWQTLIYLRELVKSAHRPRTK